MHGLGLVTSHVLITHWTINKTFDCTAMLPPNPLPTFPQSYLNSWNYPVYQIFKKMWWRPWNYIRMQGWECAQVTTAAKLKKRVSEWVSESWGGDLIEAVWTKAFLVSCIAIVPFLLTVPLHVWCRLNHIALVQNHTHRRKLQTDWLIDWLIGV